MGQRRSHFVFAACLAGLLLPMSAQAGTIQIDTTHANNLQIQYFEPLGQTFTAIDPLLTSIGFGYVDMNPSHPNDPITITLYAGDGTGGSVVATRTVTLPASLTTTEDPPTFIDTNFSGTALSVGATYTVALTTTSPKVGVVVTSDTYSGGHIVFHNPGPPITNCPDEASCDLDLRVVGSGGSNVVPEPPAWALMMAGLGLLGGALGRRRWRAAPL